MTSEKFHTLFGAPPREREGTITQREMDLARSIQDVTEEAMLRIARHWVEKDRYPKCMHGRRCSLELRRQW